MSGKRENGSDRSSTNSDNESNNLLTPPNPTPRVSLPIRFSNPENPNSERPIGDISTDTIFVRTGVLIEHNTELIQNVSVTLGEIDTVLGETEIRLNRNILDQTNENITMDEGTQVDNAVRDGSSIVDVTSVQDPEHSNRNTNNKTTDEELIPQAVRDFIESRYPKGNSIQESGAQYIGLEAALKLLPSSFSGEKPEDTEIFLEKCEFALTCAQESIKERLLKGIQVRLTGKARQAVKFKTINSWNELKDTLKSALEPQRTTTYLFSELYSIKQKSGEDIISYANRVEQLQTLILEQETDGKTWEVAQALEASIKKQTIQVFVEGLGPLKDFIKARNPPNLDKAIQAAREEERVRTSNEETKKLYGPSQQAAYKKPMCFNCGKIGHTARDCKGGTTKTNPKSIPSTTPVRNISCLYCKKPGHMLKDCRKRAYVNSRKDSNNQGNQNGPGSSGGRPVSEIKSTGYDKPSTSKQN